MPNDNCYRIINIIYRFGHVLTLTVCIIIIHDDVEWLEYDTYIKVGNV
jgi:hypothetical protein